MITNHQISNLTISQIFSSTSQSAITTAIFCNVSTSTAALDVYIVPFPQNASSLVNQVIKGVIIPPAETFVLDTERFILEDKDAIYAQVDAGIVISTISSVNT
jgi:hypothetical protein